MPPLRGSDFLLLPGVRRLTPGYHRPPLRGSGHRTVSVVIYERKAQNSRLERTADAAAQPQFVMQLEVIRRKRIENDEGAANPNGVEYLRRLPCPNQLRMRKRLGLNR